jgi:MFS family permease
MRSSVGTVLATCSALTAIGIVFAQLTQLRGFRAADHPVIDWAYLVFDVALAASVLVATAGGIPLWLQMLRQARQERRRWVLAWLSLTVTGPAACVAAAAIALRVVHHPEASGPWWFVSFAIAGFAVAGLACSGPISALHRLRPAGRTLARAMAAAGIAAACVALAGIASGIAATGLYLWVPGFAGYHHAGLLGSYLAVVAITAAIATVSAARGVRATP